MPDDPGLAQRQHCLVDDPGIHLAQHGHGGPGRLDASPPVTRAGLALCLRATYSLNRTPANTDSGCAGETAFSWVQSSGSGRNAPLGSKGLLDKNPAVA